MDGVSSYLDTCDTFWKKEFDIRVQYNLPIIELNRNDARFLGIYGRVLIPKKEAIEQFPFLLGFEIYQYIVVWLEQRFPKHPMDYSPVFVFKYPDGSREVVFDKGHYAIQGLKADNTQLPVLQIVTPWNSVLGQISTSSRILSQRKQNVKNLSDDLIREWWNHDDEKARLKVRVYLKSPLLLLNSRSFFDPTKKQIVDILAQNLALLVTKAVPVFEAVIDRYSFGGRSAFLLIKQYSGEPKPKLRNFIKDLIIAIVKEYVPFSIRVNFVVDKKRISLSKNIRFSVRTKIYSVYHHWMYLKYLLQRILMRKRTYLTSYVKTVTGIIYFDAELLKWFEKFVNMKNNSDDRTLEIRNLVKSIVNSDLEDIDLHDLSKSLKTYHQLAFEMSETGIGFLTLLTSDAKKLVENIGNMSNISAYVGTDRCTTIIKADTSSFDTILHEICKMGSEIGIEVYKDREWNRIDDVINRLQ